MQALILAGGLGTRIREALPDIPKPLAPVGGKPFLLYIFEQLKKYNLREVVLSVGYRAEMIEDVFGDGSGIGMILRYAREDTPLGTGGAIRNALPLITEDSILLINGDTYFDINYLTLEKFHHLWKAEATIALHYQQEVSRYGIVQLSKGKSPLKEYNQEDYSSNYRIDIFHEKPRGSGTDGYINGGVYLINKNILADIPIGPSSLERDILPTWVERGIVYGLPFGGKFIDIGVPEDYNLAMKEMDKWVNSLKYPTLFLDRDGVINEDLGYLWRSEDIRFIPRTIELIRLANRQGWKVIVVTNQAGVARGYYQEKDVQSLHSWMGKEMIKVRAYIDRFYYCPHHPKGQIQAYKRVCLCRKPEPGLILKAAEELGVSIEKSIMIGDQVTDIIQLPYLNSRLIQNTPFY